MSFLDNPKPSEKSFKAESLIHCDICDFESENDKERISHMREEHEDCHCCYLGDKYFEGKRSLKHQNRFIHNEYYNQTESEFEGTKKMNSNEVNQKQKKHRKKKKGANKFAVQQYLVHMDCTAPLHWWSAH